MADPNASTVTQLRQCPSACMKQVLKDSFMIGVSHISNNDFAATLGKATRLSRAVPDHSSVLKLEAATNGKCPDWGTGESVSRDIVMAMTPRLDSPFWPAGVKASLVLHSLLWHGGEAAFEAIASMDPAPSPLNVPSYASSVCGQGIKQRPVAVFIAGANMMLIQTGRRAALHEIEYSAKKGKPYLSLSDAINRKDLTTVQDAIVTMATMFTHLNYLASATDLNFLSFDNAVSTEVLNRVAHDSKVIYAVMLRIFNEILALAPPQAAVIPVSDRKSWSSLFTRFYQNIAKLEQFFQGLSNMNITLTEPLPVNIPHPIATTMSQLWDSVDAWANASAAASSLESLPKTSITPQRSNGSDNASMPRGETSPLTDLISIPFNPSDLKDSFKDGALTDDDEVEGSIDSRAEFLSAFESSSPDRFLLGTVLGRGAFGTVYRAYDTDTGTFVAIKEINVSRNDVSSIEQMREMQSEFEVLVKLIDPNVVSVFGLDLVPSGSPRIVMEWMPGGSVQAALKLTKNGIRENVVARYMRQAVSGLAYLHRHNIVHRDIKPGNMLLSATGDLKLSDFGTSRIVSEMHDSMKTGSVVGTVPYLAPECFQGSYSSASDVWALGCSALEMLSGKVPWSETKAKDALSLIFLIGNSKPPNHHPALPPLMCDSQSFSPLVVASNGKPCVALGCGSALISASAKSFLDLCFTFDHHVRPTAEDLLNHPFLNDLS